jgi:hypothetical protein
MKQSPKKLQTNFFSIDTIFLLLFKFNENFLSVIHRTIKIVLTTRYTYVEVGSQNLR